MTALLHQRCWNHASREAAARCPVCSRFYCRECVTEHDGRMMCAACAATIVDSAAAPRANNAIWMALGVAGLLLAWMIFYYFGAMLARIPSDFFEKPA